ncbi:MAG: DUF4062 domain-containing protein, partial [Planctomycetaceae bacterium]|nr:DUF4062 domain-containing protein [Planctomycetaceae bacterium]
MPASPKVFISGTTGDLGSCRKMVTDILIGKEVLPIVQDHFPPDSRTVAEMLRDKIGGCDAVICLVGTRFGAEPKERTAGEARRSYTQREYDMAVELGKPVFLFLTTPHAEVDAAPEEPLELQALQSEFRARLCSGDKVWTEFANGRELSGKVAQLRFDPESIAASLNSRLSVLLCLDLYAADEWKGRLGDDEYVREVAVPFNQLFRDILRRFADAREEQSTGHGFLATFERVQDAVQGALMFHEALGRCTWTHGPPQAGAALHLGQTMRLPGADGAPAHVVGQAVDLCRRLMTLAAGGQTLLTRPAYENASQYVRVLPAWSPSGSANLPLAPMEAEAPPPQLSWLSHGRYRFRGRAEAPEVYEVGVVGRAPLAAPGDSDKARRADSAEEEQMRGWRPATGQEIPVRPGWVIEEKLGEGGFGTVWMARQTKLQERRVFKFCHDAARLQSFKRELTLARLMREELGTRDDITRLHDLRLDAPPYFLESEFVPGGNLQTWIERRGGFERVSLAERVCIVAAVATATAAAHSAGIVHRDLKPTNVLMSTPDEGARVVLSDFGIGGLADRNRLEQHGITAAGFTEKSLLELGSSR